MRNTKTRLSVTLDPQTLDEAVKQTGASNKRQAIEQAVRELVETRKRKALAGLIGTGIFAVSEAEFQKQRRQKHARR